jgi:hypothetical protein
MTLTLSLAVGFAGVASAADLASHAAVAKAKKRGKKKCKANWVFKKGKCRRQKGPRRAPFDNSPRDIVRATATWQGNANLDLIVEDQDGHRAGYSPSAGGVVNEIPDATHLGDVGLGGGTETFIDHAWHPLYPDFVPNRGFLFGVCARDVAEPVAATLTFVDRLGGSRTVTDHFDPPPPPGESGVTNICDSVYG